MGVVSGSIAGNFFDYQVIGLQGCRLDLLRIRHQEVPSAAGGAFPVAGGSRGSLFIAICGRLPVGKGFLDGDAVLVGAAICSACLCAAARKQESRRDHCRS